MKWLKVSLAALGLLLVIGVIALSVLFMVVDPNKLKPVIVAEVKKQTGYDLVIAGKFSWSFYPRIGIKAERIALLAPAQKQPFVEMQGVIFVTELGQWLRGQQTLSGDLHVAHLRLFNLNAEKAHVVLHWQQQTLVLQPLTAVLYDGTLVATIKGENLLSAVPHWNWDMQFTDVQLQPLLQDVNGIDSKLKVSGKGQITLRGSASGKAKEQILSSLQGDMVFALKEGALFGADLNYLVKSADALLNKQPVAMPTNLDQTAFSRLTGTAAIKAGVVTTSDFVLNATDFVTTGSGSINLPSQMINLQLRIATQKGATTQWMIPVMIVGNLSHPDVRLDATELNIMLAKDKLEKVKNRVRDEIKEHVAGDVGAYLQNVLGH